MSHVFINAVFITTPSHSFELFSKSYYRFDFAIKLFKIPWLRIKYLHIESESHARVEVAHKNLIELPDESLLGNASVTVHIE